MNPLRPLDDVARIRALLTPERAARRPVPAQGPRGIRLDVDGRPAIAYPPASVTPTREPNRELLADVVRYARQRHALAAAPAATLRGMPTDDERRARTERALSWVRDCYADTCAAIESAARARRFEAYL